MNKTIRSLIFALALILSLTARGGIEIFNNRMQLTENGYISVVDDKFALMQTGSPSTWPFRDNKSFGKVSLIFDKGNTGWIDFPGTISSLTTIEVPVLIQGEKYDYSSNHIESFSYNKTLSIVVSGTGQIVKEMSSFVVDGAHSISAISFADGTDQDILDYMAIEVEIEVERYHKMNSDFFLASPSYISAGLNVQADATTDPTQISIHWNNITGAESYQLEYAYVNNYGTSSAIITPFLFKSNSTRIDLSKNSYSIPNIYGKGYLVYRVRAVGKQFITAENRFSDIYTTWTKTDNATGGAVEILFQGSYVIISDADQDKFNKQAVVTFAEDGKSKHSVSYFDGSLRNRQNIVKLNSEDIALVGETKYDYLGRAALTILPVPKSNSKLVYTPLFNVSAPNTEYTKANFDTELLPDPLETSSGAGKYYAATTGLTNEKQYIPDAEGYPFVRTIFTNDNTGRVLIQGGLGPDFQPGTPADHTTKYDYAKPFQPELDRLFGSEAGYANYYKKEMVTDPNGQSTVKITDMKGNVVVTSLAGERPLNLMPLSSNPADFMLNIDILNDNNGPDNNDPDFFAREIALSFPFISDRPQAINVNYFLQADPFFADCNICVECVYDLTIRITDKDGNPVPIVDIDPVDPDPVEYLDIDTVVTENLEEAFINESFFDSGSGCDNNVSSIELNWDVNNERQVQLGKGTYTVTKVLTLREDVLNYYTTAYIEQLTDTTSGCLILNDLITEYQSQIDTSLCDELSCETCRAEVLAMIAEMQDPESEVVYSDQDIAALSEWCDELCALNSSPVCESAYEAMLEDVSPHGQYGLIRQTSGIENGVPVEGSAGAINPSQFPLSVFNTDNALPLDEFGHVRSWRNPLNGNYYNEHGEIDYIDVTLVSPGVYDPAVRPGVSPENGHISPKDLAYFADFYGHWQNSWAESLVIHHPEYKYWELCNKLQESHDFDYYLTQCSNITDCADYDTGFVLDDFIADPVHSEVSRDPLFLLDEWPFISNTFEMSDVQAQLDTMLNKCFPINDDSENYLNIWQAAYSLSNPDCGNFICNDCNYNNFEFTSLSSLAFSEAYLTNFKMLYLSIKAKLLNYIITQESINQNYYNGCFSAEGAWGNTDGFISSGQINVSDQICNISRAHLFENKTPRFPNYSQIFGMFQDNYIDEYCYSTEPGNWGMLNSCPDAIEAQAQEMQNYTDLYFYDQCNQCPVERDLQGFIAGLLNRQLLTTHPVNLNLNCSVPEYTNDLDNTIAGDTPLLNTILNTDYTSGSQQIELIFSENSTNICKIKMEISDDLNDDPYLYLYNIDSIIGFCCLYDYEGSFLYEGSGDFTSELNDFTIEATVIIDDDDPEYDEDNPTATKKITVYGAISCVEFDDCSFNPICRLNRAGEEFLEKMKIIDNGSNHTFVYGPSNLNTPALTEPYENLLNKLYECNNSNSEDFYWILSSEIDVNNNLKITFTPSQGATAPVNINFDLGSLDPSDIVELLTLEPDLNDPFRMRIKIKYLLDPGPGSDFIWITSNTNCFSIGNCYTNQLPPDEGLITSNTMNEFTNIECYPTSTNMTYASMALLVEEFFYDYLYDLDNWDCSTNSYCLFRKTLNDPHSNCDIVFAGNVTVTSDYDSYDVIGNYVSNPDGSVNFDIALSESSSNTDDYFNVTINCFDCFSTTQHCWGPNVGEEYIYSLIIPVFNQYLYDINNWSIDAQSNYVFSTLAGEVLMNFAFLTNQVILPENFVNVDDIGITYIDNDQEEIHVEGLLYYNSSAVKFMCKLFCNKIQPFTSTCNSREIYKLVNDLNDYLATNVFSTNLISLNDNACSINIFPPGGATYGIGGITEIVSINAYNSFAFNQLIDNNLDLEVYARMTDNSIKLFYAYSDCFEPDCWCKKNLAVPNGNFSSTTGDYTQPVSDIGFWSYMQNPVYADLTNGCFGSHQIYQFNPSVTLNYEDYFLAYDFKSMVDGDFVLWANNFAVDPYTEYDFSCELFYAGSDVINIDLREITNASPLESVSLINSRAGYYSLLDSPENTQSVYVPAANGVSVDFSNISGTNEDKRIVLRGTFNSQDKAQITLGIVMQTVDGQDFYLAMDDVMLKKQEVCACEIEIHDSVSITRPTCQETLYQIAEDMAIDDYNEQLEAAVQQFRADYINHCLSNISESFHMTLSLLEGQTTLYYYDLAGNLIRTVPPKGVMPVDLETYQTAINEDRENGTHLFHTSHKMSTVYKYNSLGQLVAQFMPDHDKIDPDNTYDDYKNYSMLFWHDKIGRILASQNAKQYLENSDLYSYTLYDPLGRVTESGQIVLDVLSYQSSPTSRFINYADFEQDVSENLTKTEVVKTFYDNSTSTDIPGFNQENLRNRVSYSTIDEDGNGTYDFATFYSYDIHGNVKSLVHEIVELADIGQQYKRIDYDYDLISGNVKKVSYQAGEPDQYYHVYEYDADNRITNVLTSDDNFNWSQDAKYFYYQHGPLARVELGNDKVQAIDYAYTLQGWLKGVNNDILSPEKDMGKDGLAVTGNNNRYIGPDQFGFSLGYYEGDYSPIGGTSADFLASTNSSGLITAQKDLFNGNISYMVSSSKDVNFPDQSLVLGFEYQYDQINRLRHMATFENIEIANNKWGTGIDSTASSAYSYDKNGNLRSLSRYNRNPEGYPELFDDFTYRYTNSETGNLNDPTDPDDPTDPEYYRNRLHLVIDYVEDGDIESTDIDGTAGPYTYDKIGNLISDLSDGVETIEWTASGKIKSVTRTNTSTLKDLYFKYDPMGNRIVKYVENPNFVDPAAEFKKTYYIRDAQGNIMATYEKEYVNTISEETNLRMSFSLTERPVYGSSRIANFTEPVELVVTNTFDNPHEAYATIPDIYNHTNGYKQFELTNHLGNVMAVVTDLRTPVVDGGIITSYSPELIIAKDYYPFGFEMSGRYGGINNPEPTVKYRFGFQGQEKDDEWTNQTGSHLNFKYRLYDSRTGRFYAIDPLASKYPYNSTYAFSENRVIDRIELEGLESYEAYLMWNPPGLSEEDTKAYQEKQGETVLQVAPYVAVAASFTNPVGIILGVPALGLLITSDVIESKDPSERTEGQQRLYDEMQPTLIGNFTYQGAKKYGGDPEKAGNWGNVLESFISVMNNAQAGGNLLEVIDVTNSTVSMVKYGEEAINGKQGQVENASEETPSEDTKATTKLPESKKSDSPFSKISAIKEYVRENKRQ